MPPERRPAADVFVSVVGCKTGSSGFRPEPAKQYFADELLNQHPFRANAVDRVQQQSEKLFFRLNRGSTALGIALAGGGVQPIQGLIGRTTSLA